MENKCICACHDYEWNSTTKRQPLGHDTKCCDVMNGYLVIDEKVSEVADIFIENWIKENKELYENIFSLSEELLLFEVKWGVALRVMVDKPEAPKGRWSPKGIAELIINQQNNGKQD